MQTEWKQNFYTDGIALRDAISQMTKEETYGNGLDVFEALINLLSKAMSVAKDDEEKTKLECLLRNIAEAKKELEEKEKKSMKEMLTTINFFLNCTYDLFDEERYWIGV
jgi:seryl-tRNA synthetase